MSEVEELPLAAHPVDARQQELEVLGIVDEVEALAVDDRGVQPVASRRDAVAGQTHPADARLTGGGGERLVADQVVSGRTGVDLAEAPGTRIVARANAIDRPLELRT